MVGRELNNQFPPKTNKPGEPFLKVEHLTGQYNGLRDVNFTARRGEILGLAGLDGSGRTETLECIFGVMTRKDGVITLDGKPCRNRNARESIKNGFALLTEERRSTGIFSILNIRENTVISSLKKHRRGIWLSNRSMKKDTQWSIDAMHTKTPSQETKIRSLSGGNQPRCRSFWASATASLSCQAAALPVKWMPKRPARKRSCGWQQNTFKGGPRSWQIL